MAYKLKEKSTEEKEETEYLQIKNPPAVIADSQDDIEEIEERFKRRKLKLDDETLSDLTGQIRRIVDDWWDSSSNLLLKLRDWNDLYEGVTTITDNPWPGASSLHIPMPKIKAREIRSVIMRSTMRPIPFLMTKFAGPDSLYDQTKDLVNEYENFIEDKIKNDTNVHDVLKDSIIPVIRDGTVPIQMTWETDVEAVCDYKTYDKLDDFVKDYPTPEDAKISKEAYSKILHKIANGGSYDVKYEYEIVNYDGPRAYLVPLIDFVHYPTFVPRIEDKLCFGKRVWYTDYKLQDMVRIGKFEKEDIEPLVNRGGDMRDRDELTQSRDNIEGISRYNNVKSKEYQFFELVIKASLSEEDKKANIKRKYIVYYHYESNKIYHVSPYPIRKGKPNYFILRLIRRDGRLLGMSLMDDISDISLEIDILHRQRINSRTISHVPSFKAKVSAQGKFDPSDKRYRFRPGVVFWLTNMDDVEQFKVQPVDLSGSVEEEMLLMQLADMVVGSTSGFSGQNTPLDPRAPARKQQEMLRQASNRIDDYVESLIPVFSQIGSFMLDLYYQYGPNRIKYYVKTDDGAMVEQEMERSKLYNPNVTFTVNGTSVFESPEQEFQRAIDIDQIIAQNPVVGQDPAVRLASYERILRASRTQDFKNLMPDKSKIDSLTNQQGLLPGENEQELEAKMALQKQKLATRVGIDQQKMAQEKENIIIQGQIQSGLQGQQNQADIASQLIESANNPPAPQEAPIPNGIQP